MTNLHSHYGDVLKGDFDPKKVLEAPGMLRVVQGGGRDLVTQHADVLTGKVDPRTVLDSATVLSRLDQGANDSMDPNAAAGLAAGYAQLIGLVYDEPVRKGHTKDELPDVLVEKVA